MSVQALIKFVQGILTPPAGQALAGAAGTPVACSNANNSNVTTWSWSVISSPPGSSVVPGTVISTSATATFTPDLAGGYLIQLLVTDGGANSSSDQRAFQVPQPSGRLIPPFAGNSSSLNFLGSLLGWDPIMRVWLLLLDALASASFVGGVVVNGGTTTPVSPGVGWYIADTTVGNGTAVMTLSAGTYDGETHTFQVGKGAGRMVVNSAGGANNMVDPNQNVLTNTFTLTNLGQSKTFSWNAPLARWL